MRRGVGRRSMRHTSRRVRRRRVRMRHKRIVLAGGLLAIAVAGTATAVKLSQKDTQRIEQHTGKPPEDLTEAQLVQAIADLEIETHVFSRADIATLEATEPEPAPQVTPGQRQADAAGTPDYIVELEKLAELRDRGIITADDYDAKKKQLLGL